MSKVLASPRRASSSSTRWTSSRIGSSSPTQRGETIRRERRSMPRSIASIAGSDRCDRDVAVAAQRHPRCGLGREPPGGHVGVELGEVGNADLCARRSELDPERVAQRLDGRLRRAVRGHERQVDGGGERGGEEEVATGVRDVRARGANEVERPCEVHCERLVPDRGVAVDQGHLRADAGVCDRDVQAAESLDRRRDGVIHLLAVRDVAFEPGSVAARGRGLGEQLRLQAEQSDLCPAAVKPLCRERANASGAARDQDALTVEIPHLVKVAYLRTKVFTNC